VQGAGDSLAGLCANRFPVELELDARV
jgi:hypothetical protein